MTDSRPALVVLLALMNRPAGCRIWYADGIPVVSVPAEVDINNVYLLRSALFETATGSSVVVVDMTTTTFIDATGINALVAISNRLQPVGGEIRLAIGTERLRDMLQLLGLDHLFRIFTNLNEALRGDWSDSVPYAEAA
jgi:anti-sigma B factor antagonist